MRIQRISLKNYRQFREVELSFQRGGRSDLFVLVGTNGTGKTNLLNAVNWCLYGDEPHLSRDSELLPRINVGLIKQGSDRTDPEVAVEVWAETDEGKPVLFTRKERFRIYESKKAVPQASNFEAVVTDEQGNSKILGEEDADILVERFVPREIREFFFFDGERLDRYFREATGQRIRHAIFQISQIDLIENRIRRKLDEIQKEITREAGKTNPRIDETRERLEQAEVERDNIGARTAKLQEQIDEAALRIEEYEEKIRGVPDVEGLEKQRKILDEEAKDTANHRKQLQEEQAGMLAKYGILLMLWPALQTSSETIRKMEESHEIPPTYDTRLLEEALRTGACKICGRPLTNGANRRIEELLQQVSLSSEVVRQLMQMEAPLDQFRTQLAELKSRIGHAGKDISRDSKRLSEIEKNGQSIDGQLTGYDTGKIAEWHRQRVSLEDSRSQNRENLGRFRADHSRALVSVSSLKKELAEELGRENKAKRLATRRRFCSRALEVLEKTCESIMAETRTGIQTSTKKHFFDLAWKKQTFGDVEIRDDYSINLIHSMGYPCLGSLSAGERELLALSFTLALHETSGFDSPILIDTPVARISDELRANFAQVLARVGKKKQIILLFTPAEYSTEVSSQLDEYAARRYELKLGQDEQEAKAKVL